MSSKALDWGSFWPGSSQIFSNDFSTTEGVTAFFIGLIIIVFCAFVLPLVVMTICYFLRVQFYLKGLDGVTEDNVIEKRHFLVQSEAEALTVRSKWKRVVSRRLWQEFDETLVEYNGKLFSNIDAEHFFNGSSIARRIVDSRLFPTGAAILTGIGVLGTFLGLQLGLTGLHLDGDVVRIQGEIKLLVQSASIAFVTSVWGVSSSLILNFIEKYFHGRIMRCIQELQSRVDEIFPRFPIMEVFAGMRADGRESCDALNGLAEQIGSRMQESMDSFSKVMTGSIAANISEAVISISTAIGGTLKRTIEETLVPAIESMANVSKDLAERQGKGAEETMANLLERFMVEMGREGDGQRKAMHSASEEIREAMAGLTKTMDVFFQSFKEQQIASIREQDDRSKVLEDSVKNLVAHQGDALGKTNQKIADMLETFADAMGREQSRQAESLSSASGDVREAIVELSGGMRLFFEALEARQESMIAEQDERTRGLETVVQRMLNRQDEAQNETSQKVLQIFNDFLEGMCRAQEKQVGSLGDASNDVREALSDMGSQLNAFFKNLDASQTILLEGQDSRSKVLEKQINDILEQQYASLEYAKESIGSQVAATKSLLEQGGALQRHVDESRGAMDSVVARMNKTGDALADATSNLKALGAEIGHSVGRAASSLEKSVSLAENLFAENSEVAQGLQKTLSTLQDVRTSVEKVTGGLEHAVSVSSDGLRSLAQNCRELQDTMGDQIFELEEQVADCLKKYGDHVQGQIVDRMSSWDDQTRAFCENMKNAVEAMGEVVENIEMHSGRV